uniref:Glycoside hydrolase family 8 n=1 Tax=Nannochloropsis gaditana (strain CCMP526) TaxID=1093141 RepID=I2CQP6_NANGC
MRLQTLPATVLLTAAVLGVTESVAQQSLRGMTATPANKAGGKYKPFFLPYSNTSGIPRVDADYHDSLKATWEGLKARNIDPYDIKLVHRPRSETPNDAVSEGVGYGLLLALYSNDQEYFNMQLDNAERYMWNWRNFHDWRINEQGSIQGTGAATDAEEDIALACIFAQHLVDKGVWEPHTTPKGASYGKRAQEILDAMWDVGMIQDGKFLAPAAGWGGRDFVNPGYFAPAWYKIFAEFDANADRHDWKAVVDQSYESILANVGSDKGLIPDWMTPAGTFYYQGLGYNAYLDGRGFYKDAIRTHWRLATDALWFNDERAKEFLAKAYTFLEGKGGPKEANFFTMEGEPVPMTDFWDFDNNQRRRHRFEHSHLTMGMWATTGFVAAGPKESKPYSDELLSFYEGGDYWGHKIDPAGGTEDIEHNEMYFDQFLAWFGASTISGYFVDIRKHI